MLDHQMNSEQIDRGIEKSHTHGTVAHVPVHVPTPRESYSFGAPSRAGASFTCGNAGASFLDNIGQHARVVGAAGGACDERVQACAGTRGHRADVPSLAHRSPCLARTCSQLGDSFVGKSSIVLRFVKGQFNEQQVTTVGAAFLQTELQLSQQDGGKRITFGIWDTAGSERYKSLAPMYYRGAEAAVVVYDITKFDTFEGAKSWVRELKLYGQPNVVVALAANKFDHEDAREVSTHEGQAYARENDLLYFETSAKTNHNLQEMFAELGAPATTRARPWAARRRQRWHWRWPQLWPC